jgi:phosphate transport system protein
MLRENFVHSLHELQDSVLELGSMVDKALHQAINALKRRDHYLAGFVIKNDVTINEKRYQIEEQALTLIAMQQPVAHDLRFIAAVINIVGELERMGDHAKGIARISEILGEQPLSKPLIDIPKMEEKCSAMLHEALDAFLKGDAAAARLIAEKDDEIDALYDVVYRDLMQIMLQDNSAVNGATYLLWSAHNLERFADRIVNICERVIFTATGELHDLNRHTRLLNLHQPSAGLELEG